MSRIHTPALENATGATAQIYAQIRKAAGSVPNTYAAIGALDPGALKAILSADAELASGPLSRQELEVIKLVASEAAGCGYCVNAHSFLGKLAGLQPAVLAKLRSNDPTGDAKYDTLAHFVRVLTESRGTIPNSEFEAIRAAGYTEAQLVNISLALAVTAFTNIFNRINDTDIDFPAVA